ncbi:MAG: SusD/RagB family nutrient-binding outer membrane lipoprotein [Verrucomicrobia bacterium]|nr:SusD/RagB family nutrient-binding outer membrane lipoprotein [Cytophagales bacterium]
MKKIKFILVSILLTSMVATSCDEFLGDNISPNNLKTAPLPLALTAAQSAMTFHLSSDLYLWSAIFTQQLGGQGSATQPRFFDQYIVTNTDVNNAFSYFYTGAGTDFNYVIAASELEGSPAYAGISKICKAFMFSIQVDAWGKIPYSDALEGTTTPQPTYDDDQVVYETLLDLIDEGIADLGKTNVRTPANEDVIYGGNLVKWTRFANTLKLRLALHYAKVDNGVRLKAIIDAATPTTFMGAVGDNFQMQFFATAGNTNPLHQFEISRADQLFPSEFFVNLLNSKSDPRRVSYFTEYPAASGTYLGSATTSPQSNRFSRMSNYIRGRQIPPSSGQPNPLNPTFDGTAPIRMLTFAEYNFIRAEAALVYGAAGNADTFFRAGIQASMDDVGVYLPAGTTNFATNATAYITAQTATATTLEKIMQEKYVANFGVSMEPWTDVRRTGFPVIPISAAAIAQSNTEFPRALLYPLSEQQVNAVNVPERKSMAPKAIFWDK